MERKRKEGLEKGEKGLGDVGSDVCVGVQTDIFEKRHLVVFFGGCQNPEAQILSGTWKASSPNQKKV